jgi:hypothetical protein
LTGKSRFREKPERKEIVRRQTNDRQMDKYSTGSRLRLVIGIDKYTDPRQTSIKQACGRQVTQD